MRESVLGDLCRDGRYRKRYCQPSDVASEVGPESGAVAQPIGLLLALAKARQIGLRCIRGRLDRKAGEIKYGFAKQLRDALPNASYVGFTGMPVETEDKDTKAQGG